MMDPKTMIGLAATLGPIIKDLVSKSADPEKLEAVEKELKQFEARIGERFLALEREVLFLKAFAYGALALALTAMGFAFSR